MVRVEFSGIDATRRGRSEGHRLARLHKTDRYYIKKYQAETNITGYLLMDLSASMGYAPIGADEFDFSICLAAAQRT
ncbi:MAG: DUF58 domain-containing protein [Planctomycetaceae bacterium]